MFKKISFSFLLMAGLSSSAYAIEQAPALELDPIKISAPYPTDAELSEAANIDAASEEAQLSVIEANVGVEQDDDNIARK